MIQNVFKCSKKQLSQLSKIIWSKGQTTHSTPHDTCYIGVRSLLNNITQFLQFRFQEMDLLIRSSCLPSHIQSTEIEESCEVKFRFTSTQCVYLYVCEHASGGHLMSWSSCHMFPRGTYRASPQYEYEHGPSDHNLLQMLCHSQILYNGMDDHLCGHVHEPWKWKNRVRLYILLSSYLVLPHFPSYCLLMRQTAVSHRQPSTFRDLPVIIGKT